MFCSHIFLWIIFKPHIQITILFKMQLLMKLLLVLFWRIILCYGISKGIFFKCAHTHKAIKKYLFASGYSTWDFVFVGVLWCSGELTGQYFCIIWTKNSQGFQICFLQIISKVLCWDIRQKWPFFSLFLVFFMWQLKQRC